MWWPKSKLHSTKKRTNMIFSSNSVIMGWLKITWFHSKLGLKIRCCSLFSQTFLSSQDLLGVEPFLPSPSLSGQVCPDQVCPAKFAQPSLPETQICTEPNLSKPRPIFAPTQICLVPFLPQPNLPRPIFAQKWIWLPFIQNCKISSEIEKKIRKMLLPTNFFIDLSRKKLFSL